MSGTIHRPADQADGQRTRRHLRRWAVVASLTSIAAVILSQFEELSPGSGVAAHVMNRCVFRHAFPHGIADSFARSPLTPLMCDGLTRKPRASRLWPAVKKPSQRFPFVVLPGKQEERIEGSQL
jgi:hypothetical protein